MKYIKKRMAGILSACLIISGGCIVNITANAAPVEEDYVYTMRAMQAEKYINNNQMQDEQEEGIEPAILWSAGPASVCVGSACAGSICVGSACAASVCVISGCLSSTCLLCP